MFPLLKEKLTDLVHIKSALALLTWDQEVLMPKKGAVARAQTVAYLAGLLHEKFVAINSDGLLTALIKKMKAGKLSDAEAATVREVAREYEREKKLPVEFVKELAAAESTGHMCWIEARKKSDFKIFLPKLKKIVELKRKESKYVGYSGSAYDPHLEIFEPYTTTKEVEKTLGELKNFLIPFVKKIKNSKVKINPKILLGNFPLKNQLEFNKVVAEKIGFDFDAGRLDESAHPFTDGLHPQDVRITTRFKKTDLFYSLMSTIHETGHALYEQGLPIENFGTPLGESVSIGIHESQSRLWENMVGRGPSFWKYFYPKLQKQFPKPFKKIKFNDFYKAFNYVQPSLIRTESDEVTYNLHIILRFEIERGLIEGTIEPENLPKIWNAKMLEYLGVKVPNDANGVLQDVHWSGGMIGYFPTYSLGNIYSAQLYNTAKKRNATYGKEMQKGNFLQLLKWLNKKVHAHGKFYTPKDLILQATGEKVSIKHFVNYLEVKYSQIFEL